MGSNLYLDVLDCLTDTIIKTISIIPGVVSSFTLGIDGMCCNEDDNKIYLYLTDRRTVGRIIVINGAVDAQESYINSDLNSGDMFYHSGNLYICEYMSLRLRILKLSDNSSSTISLNYPMYPNIDKQKNILYVLCRSGNQSNFSYITAIDIITKNVLFTSNTGTSLIGRHAVDQNTGDLYLPTWVATSQTNQGTVLYIKNPSACGITLP